MSEETTITETKVVEFLSDVSGTDIGRKREENQDSFGLIDGDTFKFFIVADGMGGAQGGATASSLAIQIVRESLESLKSVNEEIITEAVQYANSVVFEKGSNDPDLTGMGTTFVGLCFTGEKKLILVNVGDSRAYRLRTGQVTQLTEDHTLVMELVKSGSITEEQAEHHPVAHMLTRSLGPAADIQVDCWSLQDGPAADDVYLICSDGLYNLVSGDEIGTVIQENDFSEVPQKLIDLANERGGSDNITLYVVKLDSDFPVSADDFVDVCDDTLTLDKESEELKSIQDLGLDAENSEEEEQEEEQEEEIEEEPPDVMYTRLDSEHMSIEGNPSLEESVLIQKITQSESKEDAEVGEGSSQEEDESLEKPKTFLRKDVMWVGVICIACIVSYLIGTGMKDGGDVRTAKQVAEESYVPKMKQAEIVRPDVNREIALIGNKEPEIQLPAFFKMTTGKLEAKPAQQQAVEKESYIGYNGLSYDNALNISMRKASLRAKLEELEGRIESFSKPISGKTGRMLKDVTRRLDLLNSEFEEIKTEIDIVTRKLSVWYGRRKRLKTADPINIAAEVAVSSPDVKAKKELFERATWYYLKEAEVLRYDPANVELKEKVVDLADSRKKRMQELSQAITSAINEEVQTSEKRISELNVRRDRIENEITDQKEDLVYVKILTGSDAPAQKSKKKEFLRAREVALAEYDELDRLLPEEYEISK